MEIFSNDLRIRFLKFYLKDKDTAEDKLIKTLLINSMPISIFENFEYFFNKISSDENLSNIRYIVTSQNYDSNEYFKFIAAVNKQKKNKLIYVQHGNVDGTSKYDSYDNTQLTCTHFFTWGYKYSSKQIPLFNVKVAGLKKYKKNNPIQDGLMFYGLNFPIRRFFWDVMNDYNKSFEDQFNLIENLSEKIQKKMKIKIHNTMTQFEKDKYKRYLQDKKISIPLLEKIKNQKNVKLSVFSYDSTGFYEHLSLNKPVIGFWKNPTEIVNQDAKYFYNNLIDAGIIFDDYKKLARFINEKWSNLDEWWLNKYTQKAINEFTLKFSIYEKNPEKIFASKIKAIINN